MNPAARLLLIGLAVVVVVLTVVETFDVPIRLVSYELEAPELERAGVQAVPLTVVVGEKGAIAAVLAGVPRRSDLARAIAAAGLRGAR